MKNELALNNSFDTDRLFAVLIDDICPLAIKNYRQVNVFSINHKPSKKRHEYIICDFII